ncbi:MAG: phosphonate metabolism protein/1,5-bisphosphokinase (PRPP-forming) PhnN [Promethearchaeota archaeon]|jgi:phosphonate metabolism protein PhnN/1,5-bisphosphokinase (PRPP-forming)
MVKKFPGTLFLIVGNSGSGKDSIISGVITHFPSNRKPLYAPKRFITRRASETENNFSVTLGQFEEMDKKGKFALKWNIYDLYYGIPIFIDNWLKNGHPVIINVSRTIVKEARERYNNIKVVFIDVPFEITYQRIKDRKRESTDMINKRIDRARQNQKFPESDFTIDNSGKLDDAINQLLDYIIDNVDIAET